MSRICSDCFKAAGQNHSCPPKRERVRKLQDEELTALRTKVTELEEEVERLTAELLKDENDVAFADGVANSALERARQAEAEVGKVRKIFQRLLKSEEGVKEILLDKLEQAEAERDEADRRAGKAERLLAYETESRQKRQAYLTELKERWWGIDDGRSADLIFTEALAIKAEKEAMQKALENIVKRGAICPYFIAEQALKEDTDE